MWGRPPHTAKSRLALGKPAITPVPKASAIKSESPTSDSAKSEALTSDVVSGIDADAPLVGIMAAAF